MRDRFEVVKEWVVRTKEEVKELERVQKIVGMFIETFGILPDVVEWESEGVERVLRAIAEVEVENKETILGQRIEKVSFHLIEDRTVNELSPNWEFSSYSKGIYTCYKWKTKMRGFFAKVEILTK